jgi:hypothetical protein
MFSLLPTLLFTSNFGIGKLGIFDDGVLLRLLSFFISTGLVHTSFVGDAIFVLSGWSVFTVTGSDDPARIDVDVIFIVLLLVDMLIGFY